MILVCNQCIFYHFKVCDWPNAAGCTSGPDHICEISTPAPTTPAPNATVPTINPICDCDCCHKPAEDCTAYYYCDVRIYLRFGVVMFFMKRLSAKSLPFQQFYSILAKWVCVREHSSVTQGSFSSLRWISHWVTTSVRKDSCFTLSSTRVCMLTCTQNVSSLSHRLSASVTATIPLKFAPPTTIVRVAPSIRFRVLHFPFLSYNVITSNNEYIWKIIFYLVIFKAAASHTTLITIFFTMKIFVYFRWWRKPS